jgi:GTP cyclohydrolase II
VGEENETVVHALSRPDGEFTAVVLDKGDDQPNPPCAAVFGDPEDDCLVRVHSRCVYGEIFESDNCDCRAQLRRSIELIRADGAGVLIYLDQEGRGAGLLTKAMGYVVSQTLGMDTFASYRHLGVEADSRSYTDAGTLLKRLNLSSVRLLTNNPAQVRALSDAGIGVKREPLLDNEPSEYAFNYLLAKEQHGHTFS